MYLGYNLGWQVKNWLVFDVFVFDVKKNQRKILPRTPMSKTQINYDFFYFRLIFGCFCSFWHFTRFSTKFEVNKFDVGMSSEIEFNHIFKNQYANPLFRVIIISNGTGMRHMFQNEYLNNSTRIKREISIRFLIELFELKMHLSKDKCPKCRSTHSQDNLKWLLKIYSSVFFPNADDSINLLNTLNWDCLLYTEKKIKITYQITFE